MSTLVFVDGQEGTTGLRIHEMLARHPEVEVLRALVSHKTPYGTPYRRHQTAARIIVGCA